MKRLQFHLFTSFVALYIINLFVNQQILIYIQGSIGFGALIVSIFKSQRIYQIIGGAFTLFSFVLIIMNDVTVLEIMSYLTSMGLLISLLYVIPFINHFMIVGKFDQSLYKTLQSKTSNLGNFYVKTYITSYVLTIFIFISMIPLVYSLIKEKTVRFNDKVSHQFASRAILRPLAAANTWSPIEVYIALVIAYTGSSYLILLPILIIFSISMLLLDTTLGFLKYRKYKLPESGHEELLNDKQILSMALFLLIFFSISVSLHILTGFGFFEVIVLVIIPYTVAWAWYKKILLIFMRYNQKVWGNHLWTMQNFIILLIPIGLFNELISGANFFDKWMSQLSWLENTPLLLFIFIQLSSMILAFFGFHPLVTLSLQGLFITPFLDTINPLSISIVMIVSVVANDMTGTFNIPITMLNQYFKRNPYQITLWNIGYALIFGGTGVFMAWLLL